MPLLSLSNSPNTLQAAQTPTHHPLPSLSSLHNAYLIPDHVQVQLEDWGDYTANDKPHPRGEICVRGPSVFSGYFNRPDLTVKVLSGDGWLHTGDIGERLAEDQIRVIDRKHAMFKTAGGEWVSPDAVEVNCLPHGFLVLCTGTESKFTE